MKNYLFASLLLFICSSSHAQKNDRWYLFENEERELAGFKDGAGNVKIAPKFTAPTWARKFDDIIAVSEKAEGKWTSYYLTKSGRIAGRDSMYIFDNGFDCESEGFIRFYDRASDKTGMFNSEGEIVIPAEYSAMTRAMNGLVGALKDGRKAYWSLGHDGCNHYSWVDGQTVLLNTENQILIDHFDHEGSLDYFSLLVTDEPVRDTIRLNFKGVNGKYYSFISFEKEFRSWLFGSLLNDLTPDNLYAASYGQITWYAPHGWETTPREEWIAQNIDLLKSRLSTITDSETDYFISIDHLNPFIFKAPEFDQYFNNCGESKEWVYPVMKIILNHDEKQDHFGFLRTDDGYKLIFVTLR